MFDFEQSIKEEWCVSREGLDRETLLKSEALDTGQEFINTLRAIRDSRYTVWCTEDDPWSNEYILVGLGLLSIKREEIIEKEPPAFEMMSACYAEVFELTELGRKFLELICQT